MGRNRISTVVVDPANRCADSKNCTKASDCKSNQCSSNNVCISYSDNIQNGQESDVDCGGSPSHPCDDLKMCKVHTDCKSMFCLEGGICVTRVPARLSMPPLADPSPGADCQSVTNGIAAVPSIPNASGWRFCRLKASVKIFGGATLSLVNPGTVQASGGLLHDSTSKLVFEGYPNEVSDFLSNQIHFCPSCVPQDYRMTIHLASSGATDLSPCPTTSLMPIERIVRFCCIHAGIRICRS